MPSLSVLEMDPGHKEELEGILRGYKVSAGIQRRAKILQLRSQGLSAEKVAETLGINRKTVDLWTNRYRNRSPGDTLEKLLWDAPGRGRKPRIVGDDYNLIIATACRKPKDLGKASELWTYRSLADYIRKTATDSEHSSLASVAHSTIYRILEENSIKPWRIGYYCEKRDPDFDEKLANLLKLYRILQVLREGTPEEKDELFALDPRLRNMHFITYDEKPGIQALGVTTPDKPPKPRKRNAKGAAGSKGTGTIRKSTRRGGGLNSGHLRDYEYRRLGTGCILAAMDLLTGHVYHAARTSHKSEDYIEVLKMLDRAFPPEDCITLVLDNLKVHSSEKVKEYLRTKPGRFFFIFTPKHGSWLNVIESFFSKVQRCLLRGLRVKERDELFKRIDLYMEEVNEAPVVYCWTWGLEDVDLSTPLELVTLLEGDAVKNA